jgi:hypothetical protein
MTRGVPPPATVTEWNGGERSGTEGGSAPSDGNGGGM